MNGFELHCVYRHRADACDAGNYQRMERKIKWNTQKK